MKIDPKTKSRTPAVPVYTFEARYTRDVWRFVKLLEESDGRLLSIVLCQDMLNGKYVITYRHSEELGIEVWT